MFMVHAGHPNVRFTAKALQISSEIPNDPVLVHGGDGVFVPMNHSAYSHGGKVFRARFSWKSDSSAPRTQQLDVMVCRSGMCSTCNTSGNEIAPYPGSIPAKPFVHFCCRRDLGLPVPSNSFLPKGDLRADWQHADPESVECEVRFYGGQRHDVFVCVAYKCTLCRAVKDPDWRPAAWLEGSVADTQEPDGKDGSTPTRYRYILPAQSK